VNPRVFSVPGPAQSGSLDGAGGRLVFYAWRETSGVSPAVIRLWDGSNNQGSLLLPISLNPNESIREIPGMHTLPYEVGLFLEVVSGTVEGQVTTVVLGEGHQGYGIPVYVIGSVDLTINEMAGGA
jgi:hypothetical protein